MTPCLSERNKEAILLRWFRRHSQGEYVPIKDFDQEYKRLFGKYPLWYTWEHFYRDHGLVGLRRQTK